MYGVGIVRGSGGARGESHMTGLIDWTTDYDFDTGAPIKKGLPVWMCGTAAAAGAGV